MRIKKNKQKYIKLVYNNYNITLFFYKYFEDWNNNNNNSIYYYSSYYS